jgi:hypothetical protein
MGLSEIIEVAITKKVTPLDSPNSSPLLTFSIRPWCSPHENNRVLNGLVILFGASTINENTAYSHQMYSYIPHIHKLIYLVGIAAIYMLQSDRFNYRNVDIFL